MVRLNNFPLRVYSEILSGTCKELVGKRVYYEYYTLTQQCASSGLGTVNEIQDKFIGSAGAINIVVEDLCTGKTYTIALHNRHFKLDIIIPLE